MYDFDGKKALIIGATGGMGASVAAMLSKNGAHCAFVGRDKKKLEDILSICSSFGFPLLIQSFANPNSKLFGIILSAFDPKA